MSLLRVNGVTKSFSGVKALRSGSLEVRAGEIHALVGENGAGKSTLIKIITGALIPDSGEIEFDGESIIHNDPGVARKRGIAAIYQQPALFPELTVAENIALGNEGGGALRIVDWRSRTKTAKDLLEKVGASIDPDALASELSMPQQQLVEIARAIGAKAKLLVLDEPTASLSEKDAQNLFEVIRQLRHEGVGMVYISHRLDELSQICDRVTVLRDGETIATRQMSEVDRAELVRMMVGRDVSAVFPKVEAPLGDVLLELEAVSNHQVQDISFSLRAGEILGIAGLVGSGRTELAELLFGLHPAGSGEVRIDGRPIRISSPEDAIRNGIAYVPEDRRRNGVILDFPIASNISLPVLKSLSRLGTIDLESEAELASTSITALGVKTPNTFNVAGTLSGGNQQKVALAKWLAVKPRVLILDEPTQGIDVGSKSEIHRLMCELAGKGMGIIMISSELPEILGMSDRILVMREGRIAAAVEQQSATQESLLSIALGHQQEG